MTEYDKSTIIGISLMFGTVILGFLIIRYMTYVGSPEDLYFGTLNRVMDCRRTQSVARTVSPEILDQICGKIPNISDYVKDEK